MIALRNHRGSTLIESLVAVSLSLFLIYIFASSYTIIAVNQFLQHKTLAYNLATEEIEALRHAPYSTLTDRTDSNFIEVAHNTGNWTVQQSGAASSNPNVLSLPSLGSGPTGITGIAITPGFEYENFEFEVDLKTLSSSPSGWESGVFFRYHDEGNYYRAYFSSTNLYITEVVGGAESTLNSKVKSFSSDIWYTLKVDAVNDDFDVYINDILELSTTDTDSSFPDGRLALHGAESVALHVDDVSVTSGDTLMWNFDSDSTGTIAPQWKRFNSDSLNGLTTKLTIDDDQESFSDIKKVTAKVEWIERGQTRSIQLDSLITQ